MVQKPSFTNIQNSSASWVQFFQTAVIWLHNKKRLMSLCHHKVLCNILWYRNLRYKIRRKSYCQILKRESCWYAFNQADWNCQEPQCNKYLFSIAKPLTFMYFVCFFYKYFFFYNSVNALSCVSLHSKLKRVNN